jgi:hypothetical protein
MSDWISEFVFSRVNSWLSKVVLSCLDGLTLSIAEMRPGCHGSGVKLSMAWCCGWLWVAGLPLQAQEGAAAGGGPNPIPADLVDDPHVREELGVNEFTAPSIAKLFDTLRSLGALPVAERKIAERMPLNRADLAVELGFLIADGFLVVQAGQMEKVEPLAADLTRYGKALGAGDRVNRHAASLLESARDQKVEQLKAELAATQKDVEKELVSLRDADLAHLISLGGWIRALSVASVAVDKQFTVERAKLIMREDIADYYTDSVAGLEPRISERPNYLSMRDVLSGLRNEMALGENGVPTPEKVAVIRKQAEKLVELALERQK